MIKPKPTDRPLMINLLIEGNEDSTIRPWRGPKGRMPPEVYEHAPPHPDHIQGIYVLFEDKDDSHSVRSTTSE